jgi:RNA polymerase-binding transcription factor
MSAQLRDFSTIRRRLTCRRNDLEQRHALVGRDLQRSNDPLVGDWSDRAVQTQNDEVLQAIGDAARAEMAAIDSALQRLDQGLYGICQQCGADIEPGRLQALHAITCARCATD